MQQCIQQLIQERARERRLVRERRSTSSFGDLLRRVSSACVCVCELTKGAGAQGCGSKGVGAGGGAGGRVEWQCQNVWQPRLWRTLTPLKGCLRVRVSV